MKKLFVLFAAMILVFAIPVHAQVNSSVVTVPLNYTLAESLSLTVTSGSPATFPSSESDASAPVVLNASWSFGVARHLSVVGYFTGANALVGTAHGFQIPAFKIATTSSAMSADASQGGSCNQSAVSMATRYPLIVIPPSASGSTSICMAFVDAAEAAGTSSVSTSVTLHLGLNSIGAPLVPLPDSYTGTLNIAASAL